MNRLAEAVVQDTDLAIGQAKELVETCCKTILAASGESGFERLDLVPLVKHTMKHLHLLPEDIPDAAKGAQTIKAVLGNLAMISQGMAELRNLYGTGHGKHGKHKRLPIRHADLQWGRQRHLPHFYSKRMRREQRRQIRRMRRHHDTKTVRPHLVYADIPTVPGELFAKFQTSLYTDPADAAFKALGVM